MSVMRQVIVIHVGYIGMIERRFVFWTILPAKEKINHRHIHSKRCCILERRMRQARLLPLHQRSDSWKSHSTG